MMREVEIKITMTVMTKIIIVGVVTNNSECRSHATLFHCFLLENTLTLHVLQTRLASESSVSPRHVFSCESVLY